MTAQLPHNGRISTEKCRISNGQCNWQWTDKTNVERMTNWQNVFPTYLYRTCNGQNGKLHYSGPTTRLRCTRSVYARDDTVSAQQYCLWTSTMSTTLPWQWSLITISQYNHSFYPMFLTDHCRLLSIFRQKVRWRSEHLYTRITDTCRLT